MADKPLPLESGGELPGVRLAFETWVRLSQDRSNAGLVLHAPTGDSHVTGPAGPGHPTPGWWDGMVGPGLALDTGRWFVVAPNVLGGCQGNTGLASLCADGRRRWGLAFPFLTQRDQVAAEAELADALGVERWALVVGGSRRAGCAPWSGPCRTPSALLLLATTAAASAEQIAWAQIQLHAFRGDPYWQGGDYHGTGHGPHGRQEPFVTCCRTPTRGSVYQEAARSCPLSDYGLCSCGSCTPRTGIWDAGSTKPT